MNNAHAIMRMLGNGMLMAQRFVGPPKPAKLGDAQDIDEDMTSYVIPTSTEEKGAVVCRFLVGDMPESAIACCYAHVPKSIDVRVFNAVKLVMINPGAVSQKDPFGEYGMVALKWDEKSPRLIESKTLDTHGTN